VAFLMQGYGDLGFGTWGPVFTVATGYAVVGKICIARGGWSNGKSGLNALRPTIAPAT